MCRGTEVVGSFGLTPLKREAVIKLRVVESCISHCHADEYGIDRRALYLAMFQRLFYGEHCYALNGSELTIGIGKQIHRHYSKLDILVPHMG